MPASLPAERPDPAPGPVEDFGLIRNALSQTDLDFLKLACRDHILSPDAIPSYVLLDQLSLDVPAKIKALVEAHTGQEMLYLNDFYLYSDSNFGAHWHMDTELFTFNECVNAWILLSPDQISSPLGVYSGVNDRPDNFFHSLKATGQTCQFANYKTGSRKIVDLEDMEQHKVNAPNVREGDILLLNPKKFHKTNTTVPKHALIFKFVIKGAEGVLSKSQVPSMFWSETGLFNKAVKNATQWDDVLAVLRDKLKTPEGRQALSAGFFPHKMDLYREMVQRLV